MAQIKPRTLSGFMELLPARQVQFDRMVEILRKSYSLYGFTPLDTPAIEAAEVLLAKGGGETEKQIYRFTKGDTDLALRFDLTVPLAKYVALHQNELAFPFRRFQISKVYRGERAQKGRYREFYQADIDVIGDGSLDITNEARGQQPQLLLKRSITMAQIKPRTLSGFMELLPARQVQFDRMVEILRKSYSLYGFTPLDTPAIEAAEVLLAKGGGETETQIYRFTKGDSDLALRFDLTVPLAKYVALHQNELTFPFRRFQISKVYRGERAQKGRYREFYQADIDVIGDGSLDITNEAEIPSIIYKTFTALGLRRFKIRVNNRKVLNGLFAILGLEKQAGDVMRTIDKLEKIGPEKVRAILTDDFAVPGEAADALLSLLSSPDPMAALEPFKGKNELFDLGVAELETVVRYMSAFGVPEDHFMVDLTIARGLDYYTGTVYETVMLDHPEVGSICSGGRYDNLAEYYTDKQLPGVGISIGLTRLFSVLEAQGYLNDALVTAPADVLILPMTEELSPAISFATALRDAGVRAQLHCEKKKFKQKLSYADKLSIPYAAFLGEDEIQQNKVTVKDLTTGQQQTVTAGEAVALVQAGLAARAGGTPIQEPEA